MINSFTIKKEEILNILKQVQKKINQIEEETEYTFEDSVKEKLEKAISNIKNSKFIIAFFGAFSDGKSTIISALTRSLDIKIDVEPTTDEINEYSYGDYLIVDTPGLFSDQFIHEDKTKKYISEANVIIYVVDPVNPLKASHHKTLRWLINDLKKADSTIFVINKMDEIADLEDEEDFRRHCKIKKEVIKETLKEVTGLNGFKRIVCVSGNPFGRGLNEWFTEEELYRRLSRIGVLEKIVQEFIESAKEDLIVKAGVSVLRDSLGRVLNDLENFNYKLLNNLEILENQIKEFEDKVEIFESDINRSYQNIKRDILSLREDIILEIQSAKGLGDLADILARRVGNNGYVLAEEIDLIIRRHTQSLVGEYKKFLKDLEESVELYIEIIQKTTNILKGTTKLLKFVPNHQLADMLIKFRNFTGIPIKFKPWGAIKVAKILKTVPILLEGLETFFKIAGEIHFTNKKEEIIKEIDKFFNKVLEEFTLDFYKREYFPHFYDITSELKKLKKEEINLRERLEKVNNYIEDLKNFLRKIN